MKEPFEKIKMLNEVLAATEEKLDKIMRHMWDFLSHVSHDDHLQEDIGFVRAAHVSLLEELSSVQQQQQQQIEDGAQVWEAKACRSIFACCVAKTIIQMSNTTVHRGPEAEMGD